MSNDRNGKTHSLDVCTPCKLICCQGANPPITQNRKEIITNYLKSNNISSKDIFVQDGHLHPSSDTEGFCIFYNKETRKCTIHPVKPETCKAGPVTFDINLSTCKVEFYLKKYEICAFAKVIYENKEKFKEHLDAAKEEIIKLIADLNTNDLKDLLTIDEPHTFKVDEIDLPKDVAKKLKIM